MRDSQRSKVLRAYWHGWLVRLEKEKKDYPVFAERMDVEKKLRVMLGGYSSNLLHVNIEISEQWNGKYHWTRLKRNPQGWRLRMNFPWRTRTIPHFCYEVAHVLHWFRDGGEYGHHAPAFCRAFIAVVRDHMGPHEAAWLLDELKKEKVRLH